MKWHGFKNGTHMKAGFTIDDADGLEGQKPSWPSVMPLAVVFDMDGLLLDTERLYKIAVFAACADLGYTMTDAINRRMIGGPWQANKIQLAVDFGETFPFETYHDKCRAYYADLCADGIALRPGVTELFDFLGHRGIHMAVTTSTVREMANHHLKETGLFDRLQAIVTRDDVTVGKPHPESYLTAAGHLAVDPINCLALEDSHNGARSAIAAGMATVLVPDLLPAIPEIAAQCVYVARDLQEVRDRLEAL